MKRNEKGVVIAEAAMILPVLVFLAMAFVDMQWAIKDAADIDYIATESARCEAIGSLECPNQSSTVAYAQLLATNLRLNLSVLTVTVGLCTPQTCSVDVQYQYKAMGVWFPSITMVRTGTASLPPQP